MPEVRSPEPSVSARHRPPWLRLLGLLLVAWMSIADPPVLIAVVFVELALVLGVRRGAVLAAAILAMVVVLPWTPWDGMSYMERAWALILGGWFAGITVWRPQLRFTTRALGAVAGAVATVAGLLAIRPDGWGIVEQAVVERLAATASTMLEMVQGWSHGQPAAAGLTTAVSQALDRLQTAFPALLGLASLGALGVAWWGYQWFGRNEDDGVGPLRDFRFNDHLVWVLVGGVVLFVAGWGGGLSRVGFNTMIFMGALYALRGAAVIVFMGGGMSLGGALLLIVGFLLAAPIVVGAAAIIGLGDTWLDIRSRISKA